MSNEKSLAIIPRTIGEVQTLAELFSKSSLLPEALRGKAADVLVSIMAGQELGLSPMAALRGVHVVQGKPVLSADTMVGIVLGSGLAAYFSCVAESDESVTYETKRVNSPQPQRGTWTMADAKRAGLTGNPTWAKYPRAMMKARAKAALARDVYPDVLAGCYDPDEASEFTPPSNKRHFNEPASGIVDAEIVERDSTPHPLDQAADALIADIEAASSAGDIDALAPRFAALPKGTRQRARAAEAFKARREMLAAQEPAAQQESAA